MRSRPNPVEALAALPRLSDVAERRANWRQAIAALSQSSPLLGPPPLDGVDRQSLELAVGVAIDTGLADDLDWIAPGSAALALYEVMAAISASKLRREIGRRVLSRINEGTAATFAAVAARMALGSGRTLESPAMQARMGLLFDMPIGSPVHADPLALTIVSRRDLFRHWIDQPSTGALPARRLAARLFEHAAREAAHRVQSGAVDVDVLITSEWARPVFDRLLGDREPLVWRHAASARGLLSTVSPRLRDEIELALDPGLTPTEWRRAAVSLVAATANNPEEGFVECLRVAGGELAERDPGILASMVLGLPRVIEAEPDMAEELLQQLGQSDRADVAEAIADLLNDVSSPNFGQNAGARLHDSIVDGESGALVPQETVAALDLLAERSRGVSTLGDAIRQAMTAFETEGARHAFELANGALAQAHQSMDRLEAGNLLDLKQLPQLLAILGDLDLNVLEHARLSNLLLLKRRPGETDTSVPELDRFYNRLSHWLIQTEQRFQASKDPRPLEQAHKRCLKTLLHLVDLETATTESDESGVRVRLRHAIRLLLSKLATAPSLGVHRILSATLARSFDAAVREGVYEASEILLSVLHSLSDGPTVLAIAEASIHPDVREPLTAYANFLNPREETYPPPPLETSVQIPAELEVSSVANSVLVLAHQLTAGGAFRGEALKQTLLRLGRALRSVASARGLKDLVDQNGSNLDIIGELEEATDALRRMMKFAEKRVLGMAPDHLEVVAEVAAISALIERAVGSGVPANRHQMEMALAELVAELPTPIAQATKTVLGRIARLPISGTADAYAIPLEKRRAPLPDWLLPRRTIGAFYVVRALGSGGVSSVFVARRFEERHNRKAEAFALKVPHYDPTTARSLSEQQFFQMFRDEAGALLSLPQNPNLARFVTFDLAARPKPILVMELIRGAGFDRLIRSHSLSMPDVFQYLDGILAALETMHQVGVGHLDVKPSNVILREGSTPVLVDFGLSGRHLRPGCGTLEYCSPEILGAGPDGHSPSPLAADMYSFACTAYELLTTQLLFDAEDEMALMALQLGHDGWPKGLTRLAHTPGLRDLAVILAACLRHDPRHRPTASQARRALRDLAPSLGNVSWPISVRRSSSDKASA
ncbi:MAG: serine/threonine-protein kinase [Polyangiaceae bacterium]|nr:serine/threonine-protein kinase [Polyangiaceae bacterium]